MNVGDQVDIVPRIHGAEDRIVTHGWIVSISGGGSARAQWTDGLVSGLGVQFLRLCPMVLSA
jgi:hypothetical protein